MQFAPLGFEGCDCLVEGGNWTGFSQSHNKSLGCYSRRKLTPELQRCFFSAKLISLSKPDGGLRPIIVGIIFHGFLQSVSNITCLRITSSKIPKSKNRCRHQTYAPMLLSGVEQGQRPIGNEDREAIVVGASLCDGKGQRAYTI